MSHLRGHVYWVDLEPTFGSQQRGHRPCLILSVDAINAVRRTLGVIPLSSSPSAAPPIVIALPSIGPQTVALCDQLRAVDKRKMGKMLGKLSSADLAALETAVKAVFGF